MILYYLTETRGKWTIIFFIGNSAYELLKFTYKISDTNIVFLDPEVYKHLVIIKNQPVISNINIIQSTKSVCFQSIH